MGNKNLFAIEIHRQRSSFSMAFDMVFRGLREAISCAPDSRVAVVP